MRTAVEHMIGTVVSVAAPDTVDVRVFGAAVREAFAFLRHVDEVFSPYHPDSPADPTGDGLLDTSGPCGDLDGHGIRHRLELCGDLHAVSGGVLDAWAGGPHPEFDPCAAVKGWAAERASELLADSGLARHALNAGGDVRVRSGDRSDAPVWRVGVTDPCLPGCLLAVAEVHDGGVATSGTVERGTPLWDPAAGRHARGLAQVTVIGPDLALADGYATAAMSQPSIGLAYDWLDCLAADTAYQAVTVDVAGRTRTTPGATGLTVLTTVSRSVPAEHGRA